jgi:hypothetical protein
MIGRVLVPLMAAIRFGLPVTDQDPVTLATGKAIDARQ